MKKYISKFHYLTQDLPHRTHVEQVQIACQAGANWVRYRCLSKSDTDLLAEIHQIAAICDDWGATLILTNHYHLLNQVDAQGVHIEDAKADFKTIRNYIGEDKTLGCTANTFEDIDHIHTCGVVDYVSCGPFSITLPKPTNYPTLGIEGYKSVVQKMHNAAILTPILGIGGITTDAVDSLLNTGIYGLAVSSAINQAEDPGITLRDFYKLIY